MKEIKTERYIVRIHSGTRTKQELKEILEDECKRLAGYVHDTGADSKS